MPRTTNHLTRRKRVYYFRARVPSDLISAYGRAMVSISLGTGDKALAQARLQSKVEEFNREMTQLRRRSRRVADDWTGTVLHLTDDDIERLCLRYRAEKMAEDELARIRGIGEAEHQLDLDVLEDGVGVLRAAYARGDLTDTHNSLAGFLSSIGLRLPKNTPTYERLARRFQQAEIEVYDAILKRRQGQPVDVPLAPLDSVTHDDVFRIWKQRKATRPPKTVRAFEQAFEELKARTTATTAAMLTKRDAVAFRDRLIASGTCSRRTVAKHLGFLRAAFECAKKDSVIPTNPFDGVEVELDDVELKSRTRLPFSVDELRTIFSGPVYQPGFRPRPSLGASQYWLPLLALFQGARLEELAQLEVSDILEHPELGYYIYIHAGGARQVKTDSSVRQVPLHPELVRLGFLDYVKSVQTGRLFSTLKNDRYGKLGTTFSTWFGRYLTELGITDASRVFHSFRHTFIAACKQRAQDGIPPEVREAMVGHTPTSEIAATYGHVLYPLEPQSAAIQLVEFKGLDLSHLYTKTAQT